MRQCLFLVINIVTLLFRFAHKGGVKSIVSENLLLKHQLLILNRSRQKAPSLKPIDRLLFGWLAMLLSPGRLVKAAIIITPSTLLAFHQALVKRKYRRLFGSTNRGNPGPGTIRREFLDQIFFWGSLDLERKLTSFKEYYNNYRVHSAIDGDTPIEHYNEIESEPINLKQYSWQKHCAGLFHTPIAV